MKRIVPLAFVLLACDTRSPLPPPLPAGALMSVAALPSDAGAARVPAWIIEEATGKRPGWAVVSEARQPQVVTDYGGVWTLPHRITDYGAETAAEASVRVVDALRICEQGSDVRFFLDVKSDNYHGCLMAGRAHENEQGELVLVTDEASMLFDVPGVKPKSIDGPPCHVRVKRTARGVHAVAIWPRNCDAMDCGANMGAVGAGFTSARRVQGPCTAQPPE